MVGSGKFGASWSVGGKVIIIIFIINIIISNIIIIVIVIIIIIYCYSAQLPSADIRKLNISMACAEPKI